MGRVGGGGGGGHDDPGREAPGDGGGGDGRGRGVVDLAGRPIAVREGEVMTPLHDPGHEWYYYPDMTPNEALVLKIFDSRLDGGGGGGQRSEGSKEGVTGRSEGNEVVEEGRGRGRGSGVRCSCHTAFRDPRGEVDAHRVSIEVRCLVILPPPGAGAKARDGGAEGEGGEAGEGGMLATATPSLTSSL